jgi:hypothetical protein
VQRFEVTTERVAESAVALGGLSGEARGATVLIARGGDAAAETEAEGALAELTLSWVNALGQLGAVTDSMANAVALAAQCYQATDAAVMPDG